MSTPPMIQSYWRKLVDSLKQATRDHMVPEYAEHQERGRNSRYYR